MAIKLDPAYRLDADGHLTLLEVSFVNCRDTDPYRLRGTEGEHLTTIKKKSHPEKEDR